MKTAEEILKEWRKINMPKVPKHDYLQAMFTDNQLISLMDMHANQSKWISVEDEVKPKMIDDNKMWSEYVLVLYKDKSQEVHNYDFLAGDFNCLDSADITHWQPLPTAP